MSFFLKLSAYTFLALMGFSAWRAGVEGWRYYFALVLFFFCVLRILMILRQRINRGAASKSTDAMRTIESLLFFLPAPFCAFSNIAASFQKIFIYSCN
jgi:hypothetical protein